jgi:hypothetical protein
MMKDFEMGKMGFIQVGSYMGYAEFYYGVYDYQRNKYAPGRHLGRISTIGQTNAKSIWEAENKLSEAGCEQYRLIPLCPYGVDTYDLSQAKFRKEVLDQLKKAAGYFGSVLWEENGETHLTLLTNRNPEGLENWKAQFVRDYALEKWIFEIRQVKTA